MTGCRPTSGLQPDKCRIGALFNLLGSVSLYAKVAVQIGKGKGNPAPLFPFSIEEGKLFDIPLFPQSDPALLASRREVYLLSLSLREVYLLSLSLNEGRG